MLFFCSFFVLSIKQNFVEVGGQVFDKIQAVIDLLRGDFLSGWGGGEGCLGYTWIRYPIWEMCEGGYAVWGSSAGALMREHAHDVFASLSLRCVLCSVVGPSCAGRSTVCALTKVHVVNIGPGLALSPHSTHATTGRRCSLRGKSRRRLTREGSCNRGSSRLLADEVDNGET